jgi:hypothetical protein
MGTSSNDALPDAPSAGAVLGDSPIAGSPFGEPLLADLVNPLIITETGTLKPIAYDFNSRFDVASIETLSHEKLAGYKQHNLPDFQMLIGNALARLQDSNGLVDWFDYCTRLSEENVRQPVVCFEGSTARSNESRL